MTTLATGAAALRGDPPGPRNAHPGAGFTLLEIILVFGLIALAAGIVIANFTTFLQFEGDVAPETTLREAVREARFVAAKERRITTLRFDAEELALVLDGSRTFPLGAAFARGGSSSKIRFFLVPPSRGLSSQNTPINTRLEVREIRFAPDRSSSPFVAEIDLGSGSSTRYRFDPFSNSVREVR